MRNTKQEIVGLTLRYARELQGLDEPFRDFLDKNILIIGVPGKGKTSHLRCIANYLATECNREVVIVDKTNEIAGYSDVPHPIVGLARRLQVTDRQALSMLEAVENHTPNTIIVDEIRDREEAMAAKTIGERGVQLIATCHGRTFFDVVKNPVLAPVLGGISSVTLKDDTAKAAGSNKNVLERESFPTFDVAIELTAFDEIAVYVNLEESIDALLRKEEVVPTILRKIGDKWVCIQHSAIKPKVVHEPKPEARLILKKKR
jgi:stage III sporulation protein SpoIIIAA